MKWHYKTLFIVAGIAGYHATTAQTKILDHITVRKAFETKGADDSKPAILSFTAPKEKSNSFLINAGIGYDLFTYGEKLKTSATGFFVYNQNTLVDKKQKNYKLGVSAGHVIVFTESPVFALFGTSALQYLHNYIDTTHSVIVTHYWHPFLKKPNSINLGGYRATPHRIGYFILPQVGLEYQNIADANIKTKKGYDFRGLYSIGGNLKFKKRVFKTEADQKQDLIDRLSSDPHFSNQSLDTVKKYVDAQVAHSGREEIPKSMWPMLLEFSINFTGRSSLFNHNSNFEKYIPLFKAGVNIYPIANDNFSIGVSYNSGANPIDGTLKQTFWLLSISFKK